jgi:hypothetical protein
MKTQNFQMVGSTRSTLNGFGDSSGRNQPPPPPDPTSVATQNEMLVQILLHMQQQQQPHGKRMDAQGQVTKYKHFLDMNPPQFTGMEEPLDADAWIRAIEVMFVVFTLPCQKDARLNSRHCSFVVLL